MSDAKKLYEELVRQIDHDCASKNFMGTVQKCEAYGMDGGEQPNGGAGQRFAFEMTFANGDKVELDFSWRDKSKSFSVQPDAHRFGVTFKPHDGKSITHSNGYEA